jgi:hypothetical protein
VVGRVLGCWSAAVLGCSRAAVPTCRRADVRMHPRPVQPVQHLHHSTFCTPSTISTAVISTGVISTDMTQPDLTAALDAK